MEYQCPFHRDVVCGKLCRLVQKGDVTEKKIILCFICSLKNKLLGLGRSTEISPQVVSTPFNMRKTINIIMIMLIAVPSLWAQADLGSIRQGQTAQICFYRESSSIGAAQKMNVFVNRSFIVGLKSNSSFYYTLVAGEQDLSVRSIEESSLQLKTEAGRTYFLRLSTAEGATWSSPPVIQQVDSAEACAEIEKMSIKSQSAEPIDYHRTSWCSIGQSVGVGFEENLFMLDKKNQELTLSAGGGFGLVANCGYQFSRHFYLSGGAAYYLGTLLQETNEADVLFHRFVVHASPGYIIPLGTRERLRFRIGAGLGYYSLVKLWASTTAVPEYTVFYDNCFGMNASFNFDVRFSSHSGLSAALKYEGVKYTYNKDKSTLYTFPEKFKEPDGSAIYVDISYVFFF